ncbi:hypothetical protein GLAREA_09029 [Glarea lozoyensis ATCC 20868]|uniref:Uncharacterized protein n=1 Tax=Glarea lozoyensis (strain ATCC 20868 / MF5171) TaxID=1116229 RepID=S3DY74_GLAL2|nr:uncharacterized protein GLAREA_09029 [Glarea lozoyensis ATCC 20868]EPE36866.1 hypothetical protein GLAREA_09029 [Glarea lozoyensis ATCC 20868]
MNFSDQTRNAVVIRLPDFDKMTRELDRLHRWAEEMLATFETRIEVGTLDLDHYVQVKESCDWYKSKAYELVTAATKFWELDDQNPLSDEQLNERIAKLNVDFENHKRQYADFIVELDLFGSEDPPHILGIEAPRVQSHWNRYTWQ